jgi:hypothetical protein
MSKNQETELHWSEVLHIDSEHVIRGVLMQVAKLDRKKATLEPADDFFDEDNPELWCTRMICGEFVEMEDEIFQVAEVTLKRMTLEPCDISPDTPRWKKGMGFERRVEV